MAENILSIIIRARDQGAAATLNGVGVAVGRLGDRVRGLDELQHRISQSSDKMMMAGVGLAGALTYLGRSAASGEQALREVNTILKLPESDLERFRQKLAGVGDDYVVLADRVQLANAAYDVASVKGFQNLDLITSIVHSAAVLATGGKEQVDNAINTVMDIMAAYRKRLPAEAEQITDEIYKAVEIGRMRVPELHGEIGPVMGVAAQMNVSEKEILAGLAVLTNAGFSTSEAATALERSLTSALQPSKAFTAAAKQMGYESAAAMVRAQGLAGSLRLVETVTKGDETALAAINPNVRALRGALALGGEAAADFADAIRQIGNSQGAARAAAEEAMKGPAAQWQRALVELKNEGTDLGRELFPVMKEFASQLAGVAKAFNSLSPEQRQLLVHTVKLGAELALVGGAVGKITSGVIGLLRLKTEFSAMVALIAAARGAGVAVGGGSAAGAAGNLAGLAGWLGGGGAPGAGRAAAAAATSEISPALRAALERAAWRASAGVVQPIAGAAPRSAGRLLDLAGQQGAADRMIRELAGPLREALAVESGGRASRTAGAALADRMIRQQMGLPEAPARRLTTALDRLAALEMRGHDRLAIMAREVGSATQKGVMAGGTGLAAELAKVGPLIANPIGLTVAAALATVAISYKASGVGGALAEARQKQAQEATVLAQLDERKRWASRDQVGRDLGYTKDELEYGTNIDFEGWLGGKYVLDWDPYNWFGKKHRYLGDEDQKKIEAERQRRAAIVARDIRADKAAADPQAAMNKMVQGQPLGDGQVYWSAYGAGPSGGNYQAVPTGVAGSMAYVPLPEGGREKGAQSYSEVLRRGSQVNNLVINATIRDEEQLERVYKRWTDQQFGDVQN